LREVNQLINLCLLGIKGVRKQEGSIYLADPAWSEISHPTHGWGCACHSPQTQQLLARLDKGVSRRSVLKGVAASLAAPALGIVSPAFAQSSAKPILLRNVTIFDGTNGKLVKGRDVLVEGRLIKALVASGDTVTDADIIDCGGRTLMPGMIDAHWHTILAGISQMTAMTADIPYVHLVAAQEAERTVLRGFTTVRDTGGPSFALKRAIDEGRIAGPRIYPSGAMISQTSGHGDFRMRTDLPRTSQSDPSIAEQAGIAAIADGEARCCAGCASSSCWAPARSRSWAAVASPPPTIRSTRSSIRKPR
jgi:hypothetical protein